MLGFNDFTFGSDPEMFVRDAEGKLVSPEPFIPGTKAEPYRVSKGCIQVDGLAAEINPDPARTFAEWDENITTTIKDLRTFLPKGFTLSFESSVTFPDDVMHFASDRAKELGCTPDFNAWTGEQNPAPDTSEMPNFRTASGHIAIGWTKGVDPFKNDHFQDCADLVKQLDWYLGAWGNRVDKSGLERRKLYGKAGAFRPKEFGVEYRVLSNFWLTHKRYREAVWNRMQQALIDMSEKYLPEINPTYSGYLQHFIDTGIDTVDIQSRFHYPIRQVAA